MAKFNFWERMGFYGKNPKSFKRDAGKQLKKNALYYLQNYGRAKWISVEEIFKETLEKSDLWNSNEGKMFFAESGIRNKINGVTHTLRREGHPIISGKGKKGYRYADENCNDFIDRWNEKFNAWDERGTNLITEREIDIALIKELIKRLQNKGREKEARQLQVVVAKYRKKNVEDES